MRLIGFFAFVASVHATALTAILAGGEKSCYYADVDGVGEKIGKPRCCEARCSSLGFYFAVQSGGSFDIDFVVMDPDDKVLLEGSSERQGDYIFTANKVSLQHDCVHRQLGEYSFCFENDASTSDKLLDFE